MSPLDRIMHRLDRAPDWFLVLVVQPVAWVLGVALLVAACMAAAVGLGQLVA